MLRRVALVRTDVSKELGASFIRVKRLGELGTTLAVTSNRSTLLVTASVVPSSPSLVTLMKQALSSSETSILTRATRRNIQARLVFLQSVRWLLVTSSVVSGSPILVTLMKKALISSETSVLTRATQRNIPGDAIL
jgi:hypothetical protein